MLTTMIDKSRNSLSAFARFLGEESFIKVGHRASFKKAEASLNVDFKSLRELLPYESIDSDLLFINKNSTGFGLHLMPASGADETLVKSMAELFKNKLPIGVDCTVMLFRHHHIGAQLTHGLSPMEKLGGIYSRLAQMCLKYHAKASRDGYKNARQIAAKLSDYQCYLFFSMRLNTDAMAFMQECRANIESELNVAGLSFLRVEKEDFVRLCKSIISPNLESTDWPIIHDQRDEPLSHMLTSVGSSVIEVENTYLDVEISDSEGRPMNTRVINCHIEKWPQQLALWQTPDLFANMLKPEHGLPCDFLISFTVRGVNQDKVQANAKRRAKSLNTNSNAIQNFLNPGAKEEVASWNAVYEEVSLGNAALFPTFYNVVLFTTKDKEREVVAKAMGAYRQLGFELQQSRATQWIRFLASLPFMATEGFFKDLKTLGHVKLMTHFNIANLMPIVASTKGSSQGLLLPTHRNQIAFLDTFDNKSLPITNFNFLTVGSSGAGKSMFQQAQILSGLALGEMTYVIDLGNSYKHLCEMVGGTYIDVSNITLNPFTLFDFDGKTQLETSEGLVDELADNIQIRDLLAIMASPQTPVCDIQKSYLLDAARTCWTTKGRDASMDDVLDALRARVLEAESKDDTRLNDLIILLKKYGKEGVYGHLFNGKTSLIQESNLVVFEMGGFQSNPDLLTIVMFVMIVIIQGQFYQTDRRIKKRCIIDEAWRFLTAGSNPIAANFIEQGFRTARKHNGGFGVITQYLADTEKTIQGQAIAASSDTKIIMRQGNFKEYVNAYPTRFSLYQQQMIETFGDVKGEGFSNLMIEAGNSYSFHRYFADPFSRILFSSSGDEYGAVEALVDEGLSLEDAVQAVSDRFYGDVDA